MRVIVVVVCLVVAIGGAWRAQRNERLETEQRAQALTGGDPGHGKSLARELGCASCHRMPGIRRPQSRVGPSLQDFAQRAFIAGTAQNTPANLDLFLRNPQSIAPLTAMPNLRLNEAQSRDLSAYLYTLR